MSRRHRPPKRSDYETEEEYDYEVGRYEDAMEGKAEERRLNNKTDYGDKDL